MIFLLSLISSFVGPQDLVFVSLLVDSTIDMNILKVEDTLIQATCKRFFFLDFRYDHCVLVSWYRTLSWITSCLEIMLCAFFFNLNNYILKLAYRFRVPLLYDASKPFTTQLFHRVEHVGCWCVIVSYMHFALV